MRSGRFRPRLLPPFLRNVPSSLFRAGPHVRPESSLRSCRTVRPSTGCTRSGNISSSGASTKSRRSRSGCGIVSRSLPDDPVFVEQHVDVHRPRAVARIRRSHPSQYPLDTLAFVEYPLGRQWGFDREHLVQESFVGFESPWFRLSERRAENDPPHRFGEQPYRFGEILGDRTEVRARYQHHARHYSRFISLLTVSAK